MGEAELIKQCMRGVNAARKELYDTYAEQMLGICFLVHRQYGYRLRSVA